VAANAFAPVVVHRLPNRDQHRIVLHSRELGSDFMGTYGVVGSWSLVKLGTTAAQKKLFFNVSASTVLYTLIMQWTPIGIFLRQQAVLANAMGQAAPTSRR
jgi:hypothetical protein